MLEDNFASIVSRGRSDYEHYSRAEMAGQVKRNNVIRQPSTAQRESQANFDRTGKVVQYLANISIVHIKH